MKIARITTTGVRGLPDRTFDLTDPANGQPFDMVFVTGPSGSGKTSFLDAIAAAKEDVAPYGARKSTAQYVRHGAKAAKIKIDWWLGEPERASIGARGAEIGTESILAPHIPPSGAHDVALQTLLETYDHTTENGKVEYFHAHRTLARGATGSSALSPDSQASLRLGKEIFKYAVLPRYLLEIHLDGEAGPAEFQKRFATLSETKKLGGLRKTGSGREVFFTGSDGAELAIEDLSGSEQMAVLFAATSMFLGLSRSLLLIDTPEKHLESGRVVPFTFALPGLGVDNQLIVATGSKELVSAANPQAVIKLG